MSLTLLEDAAVLVRPLGDVTDGELTAAERGLADASGSEHRAKEIRAGRAAVHALLREVAPGLEGASVLRGPEGAPRMDPPTSWRVSLAHDRALVGVALADRPIGMDLLPIDRFEQAQQVVQSRISTGRGAALAGRWPEELPEGALLWTAWEAIGKLTTKGVLGGAMLITLVARAPRNAPIEAEGLGVRVRWFLDEGALVAVALERG